MNRLLLVVLLGMFLFVGCVVGPGHRGSGMVVCRPSVGRRAGNRAYYYQSGYHYHYQNDRCTTLTRGADPGRNARDRYPERGQFKDRGHERGRDDERGKGEKRGHDERDRY